MLLRNLLSSLKSNVGVFILAAGVISVNRPLEAQEIPLPSPIYQTCHDKMMSQPLLSYSDLIVERGAVNTRRILLEQELTGVLCSDNQLIAFMEHHGMPFLNVSATGRLSVTGHGTYNKLLNFCVASQSLFQRLRFGQCAGVVRIALLDNRLSHVIAHGGK